MLSGTHRHSVPMSGLGTHSAQVREIVGIVLGISPNRVRGGAALVADLGATSLDFVELVMAVEDEFDIEISDIEADKLVTPDDLVALVDRMQAK